MFRERKKVFKRPLFQKTPFSAILSVSFGSKNPHIKKTHINKHLTGLSRDFLGGDFVYVFPPPKGMTRKAHKEFWPPTQSRDNPANLFMFLRVILSLIFMGRFLRYSPIATSLHDFARTEQMDAEGLGRKLLLTLSGDPCRAPENQTMGAATVSHRRLTLQALSSSLNAGTAKRGCLGRGEAFGVRAPAVCPPKRPRPFAHYRLWHTALFFP